jgi:hypothetical protein
MFAVLFSRQSFQGGIARCGYANYLLLEIFAYDNYLV